MANQTESDWKLLRSLHDEMLAALCGRINQQAGEILRAKTGGEHATYLRLFKHIQDSDRVVAECFNGWRRSIFAQHVVLLRRHKVMTDAQLERFSPGMRETVRVLLEV